MLLLLFDLGHGFHDYGYKGGNLFVDRLFTFLLGLRQLAFLVKDEPRNCPASRCSASSDHLCVLNRAKDVFSNSILPNCPDSFEMTSLGAEYSLNILLSETSFLVLGVYHFEITLYTVVLAHYTSFSRVKIIECYNSNRSL